MAAPRSRRGAALGLVLVLLAALPAAAADRDGDGLRDGFEARYGVTDPDRRDSDGDGVIDAAEDNDGDKLGNLGEQRFGTHPGKRDSDGDGRSDGREDKDGDGRSNAREQDQRPLPAGLRPSLAKAPDDNNQLDVWCGVRKRSANLKRCVFGDPDAATTVVLMGDSHAMAYLEPVKTSAEQEGWRLLTLFKGACVPLLGVDNQTQARLDGGETCRTWRRTALAWLREQDDPPDLVVIAHSDRYAVVDRKGRRLPKRSWPAAWKDGLERTLAAMPDASRVLVLGDVPKNSTDPVRCLRKHRRDMSACVTRRQPPSQRRVEKALRRGASAGGAQFRTLHGQDLQLRPLSAGAGSHDDVARQDPSHRYLQPGAGTLDARPSERGAAMNRSRRGAALGLVLLLLAALPAAAADRDGDGLRDGFEARYGVTDPDRRDSDGDGVIDAAEDNDGDKLGNLGEQRFGTHPGKRDSDGDGRSDGREDKDGDGRSNAREQDQRPLPAGLRPSLAKADKDFSPYRQDCQTWQGLSRVTTCDIGPPGDRTIVLIGDSHATMYISAMRPTLRDEGWHVTTMLKSGCPPLLGVHSRNNIQIDGGRSCREWRRKVVARLAADPPDHILIAHSDAYALHTADGRPIPSPQRPRVWKRGLKRTLDALPETSSVLVIGDVPDNRGNPLRCLRKHGRDISACVTSREPRSGRSIEAALRQAAAARGAAFRTLYSKICTYDPCPLVQGKIMVWRDEDHLSETFANQLEPSVRALLVEELTTTPAGKR